MKLNWTKIFISSLIGVLFNACSTETVSSIDTIQEQNTEDTTTQIRWLAYEFYPNVYFSDSSTVIMEFNAQCQYEFQSYVGIDKNWLAFSKNMDCTSNLHLNENFELSSYPKKGNPFIKYRIYEDTLYFEFLFPEWIDSINAQQSTYPLFANKYVKHKF